MRHSLHFSVTRPAAVTHSSDTAPSSRLSLFFCPSIHPRWHCSFHHCPCLCPTMASSPSKRKDIELTEITNRSTDKQDDLALARLGKKAVLKVSASQRCIKLPRLISGHQRRFGFLSILGFSCTVLITWEGSLV